MLAFASCFSRFAVAASCSTIGAFANGFLLTLGTAKVEDLVAGGFSIFELVAAIGGAPSPVMKNQTPIPSIAVIPAAIAISRDFAPEDFGIALIGIGRIYGELIDAKPC